MRSFTVTDPFRDADPNGLPIDYQVATNEIGYIRMTPVMTIST